LSPDETLLAVIEASRETVCILHLKDPKLSSAAEGISPGSTVIKRFSALKDPTAKPLRSSTLGQDSDYSPHESIAAVCWYPDSSRLVISCASGSLYIIEK
jgi:hypothetical protein